VLFGAIRDYIVDGITGLLYQLGDVEGLTRLIDDSYATPPRLDAMGHAAKQRYMDLFTQEGFHRPATEFIYASV
jgi:glycosyltransferase involved in cell wall biosynthesis